MYEEFFGFQRRPFSATPDAPCFVPLETHQGVLDALAVSCERGQGISVLTGEAGLGKSLVGLRLAFELQPTFATAFLGHSAYATRRALLQAILFELNRPYDRKAEQELRLDLASVLKSLRSEHAGFVLVIDEAHRLSMPLLDEVRLLTLLADAGEPLARVVLIGNRDLEERLVDPDLAEFNQRICCQVDLAPLTQAESLEYLRSNLELAGARAEDVFTADALAFLAKAADGVPRCLNHLADHSLLLSYVVERRPVTVEAVREALDDLKQLPLQWNDPISGGEIYRGLSQRPPMEDSAVDLWPQTAASASEDRPVTDAWDSAFGQSSVAIEIGGEQNEATVEPAMIESEPAEQLTCLKDNWQQITRPSSSEVSLLDDVTDLARSLGQTFAARDLEFGAPSPKSFAVEEFATNDESSADFDPDQEFRDESVVDDWNVADHEETPPVWNLPQQSWSNSRGTVVEFEEEPVIDRYVRIEAGVSRDAAMWNVQKPHTHTIAQRSVTAVKSTRLVMASEGSPDEPQELAASQPQATNDTEAGIVESYSRRPRNAGQTPSRPLASLEEVESLVEHVESLPQEKRDWHLPTELLQATQADDGIEEQVGAEVLDMYLEVQQSLIDHKLAARQAPNAAADSSPTQRSVEERLDRLTQPQANNPDAIQRAYGRLFSDLRRRRK